MKYFIIAGEASGDLHAADLIRSIRELDPEAGFAFFGGDKMALAAGVQPVVHYRQMAFMGFSEVLRHLGDIRANFATARRALSDFGPDRVVLVDYPGFNLKMARYAHSLGLPVYYYISPKVWAWKRWRVRQMRRYLRRVLSILPFEVSFMQRYRVPCTYVGNPTWHEIKAWEATQAPVTRQGVALVPGSRVGEIRTNLPVMLEAARLCGVEDVTIAGAPNIPDALYHTLAPGIRVVRDDTWGLMRRSQAALVTSGTATLECAIIGTPQVVCYRSNGSRLNYNIMRRLLSVRYVSLPNLIADAPALPEMLLHRCTSQLVAEELRRLLDNPTAQLTALSEVHNRLSSATDAPSLAARTIVKGG